MPEIFLPTLHPGQAHIYKNRSRFNVVRCGRRWGKTKKLVTIAADAAAKGKRVGLFAPASHQLDEVFDELKEILSPIEGTFNRSKGRIRPITKGILDFWTLDDNPRAGRGREYDIVMIDEAAFTKNKQMLEIWEKSIEPTLLIPKGSAWVYSTPNGDDPENFFHAICNNPKLGFKEFYAPTSSNPYVPAEDLEEYKRTRHPLIFKQEYLAEFVDWSGVAFFSADKLTVDSRGVEYPMHCDCVYAVVDSAMKDGSGNDGTAVTYFGLSKHFGHPLTILDWEIVQINSDLLSIWLPNVFKRLEQLSALCKARMGSIGTFIEDKGSGITLNQHSARMGWPSEPIKGDITAVGKDGRAIGASGPVYRGDVKISAYAYDKVTEYKGQIRNHFMSQVCGYRISDKDAAKRADDLADTFTYGVIIGLNGEEGF